MTDKFINGRGIIPHRFWPESEDCLNPNVWTKSLDRDAKKPVLVWFHGGGYSAGSSIEMVAYDNVNLADYGDLVVVTVNHRLNMFGYFDLSSFGEDCKATMLFDAESRAMIDEDTELQKAHLPVAMPAFPRSLNVTM